MAIALHNIWSDINYLHVSNNTSRNCWENVVDEKGASSIIPNALTGEAGERIEMKGWIKPCEKEIDVSAHRATLEAIGIKVGVWDMFEQEFQECEVSDAAMDQLDPLWGQYIWGLR